MTVLSLLAWLGQGVILVIDPKTGYVATTINMLTPNSGLVDTLACAFDALSGILYVNAIGTDGFYL